MNLEVNDRETTVLLTALDLLRDSKQRAIIGDETEQTAFKQVNQYDLLAPQHTLMHTLTLMSKITKQPVEYFTRNPSQNPTPQTHEQPESPKPSTAP
jgi:hypothetical protein